MSRPELDGEGLHEGLSFVGRSAELARLRTLIKTCRAVAVVGAPGIGKSRLAQRFAWMARPSFTFATIRSLRDFTSIDEALLDIARAASGDATLFPHDALAVAVRVLVARGPTLLVLDHVDRLAAALLEPLGALLAAAPELRVVLVSRRPLPIPATPEGESNFEIEATLTLGPLRMADASGQPGGEAGALFIERLRATVPALSLDAAELRGLVDLVRRLGGVPLALELAAARASTDGVLATLRDLIAGDARRADGADPGPVARAYSLLAPIERAVLAQCTVFRGSFSLEAACKVLRIPDGVDLADVLVSLARRNLVQSTHLAPLRLVMISAIADRAAAELGALAPLLADRHAAYYGARAAEAFALRPTEAAAWASGLARDRDNLESALAWADGARGASEWVLRAVIGLELLGGPGIGALGEAALDRALLHKQRFDRRLVACASAVRVRARLASGRLSEALREATETLAIATELGDGWLAASMQSAMGAACFQLGALSDALVHFGKALSFAQRENDRVAIAASMQLLGAVHQSLGDVERARVYYESAMSIALVAGDGPAEARAAMGLGSYWLELGELGRARVAYERARGLLRSLMLPRPHRIVTAYLGLVYFAEGRDDEAESSLRWAADRSGEAGDLRVEGVFLGFCAAVMAHAGKTGEARSAFSRARALLADNRFFGAVVDLYRGHLDAAEAKAAIARGDFGAASAHLLGAKLRIDEASAPGDSSSGAAADDRRSLIERSDDARIAMRSLRVAIEEAERQLAALRSSS